MRGVQTREKSSGKCKGIAAILPSSDRSPINTCVHFNMSVRDIGLSKLINYDYTRTIGPGARPIITKEYIITELRTI